MGVHHAWGRSLKDLFQRYQAMQGDDLRFQNGFDCQGLWVEVEVEKALGLNSKRGDRGVRPRPVHRAPAATVSPSTRRPDPAVGAARHVDGLGAVVLHDDRPNIEYIWRFLQECHGEGWLYTGHRPMIWCPRCGTSLSQHELTRPTATAT